MNNTNIKIEAKQLVQNKILNVFLIPSLIVVICTIINSSMDNALFAITTTLLTGIASLIYAMITLDLKKGIEKKSSEYIPNGTLIAKSLVCNLIIGIAVFGVTFVFSFIGLLSNNYFIAMLFVVLASIFSIYINIRFSMLSYILVENPSMGIMNLFKESGHIIKGHMLDLIGLNLSFILWLLLVGITFGIAQFYVAPYMYQSYAIFYLKLKEEQNIIVVE